MHTGYTATTHPMYVTPDASHPSASRSSRHATTRAPRRPANNNGVTKSAVRRNVASPSPRDRYTTHSAGPNAILHRSSDTISPPQCLSLPPLHACSCTGSMLAMDGAALSASALPEAQRKTTGIACQEGSAARISLADRLQVDSQLFPTSFPRHSSFPPVLNLPSSLFSTSPRQYLHDVVKNSLLGIRKNQAPLSPRALLKKNLRCLSPHQHRQLFLAQKRRESYVISTFNSFKLNPLLDKLHTCHRLRRPEDAFVVGGPVLSEEPGTTANTHDSRKKKDRDGDPKMPPRRRRPDRSLLLEDSFGFVKGSSALFKVKDEGMGVDEQSPIDNGMGGDKAGDGDRSRSSSVCDDVSHHTQRDRAGTLDQTPYVSKAKRYDGAEKMPKCDGGRNMTSPPRRNLELQGGKRLERGQSEQNEDIVEEYEETLVEKKERIEREILSYYKHIHRRRMQAACVVQRAWRCSRARSELHTRRQVLYQYIYVLQRAAALCIDGFLRSIVLQKKRIEMREEHIAMDKARAEKERQCLGSTRIIEHAVKRWLAVKHERERLCVLFNLKRDSRLHQYASAALKIQRWWPHAVAQRAYWVQKNVQLQKEKIVQQEAMWLHVAATKIQRIVRGRLTRRAVAFYKVRLAQAEAERLQQLAQRTDLLVVVLREYSMRQERLRQERSLSAAHERAAADAVQSGMRAGLEKRRFEHALAHARRLRASAECIQRAWRRFCAGRERRYLRELQQTIFQERLKEENLLYSATLRLQSFARGVLMKAAERRKRAETGRAIYAGLMVLGRVGRGWIARRELGQRRCEMVAQRVKAEAELAVHRIHSIQIVQGFIMAKQSGFLTQRRRQKKYLDTIQLRALVRTELEREAKAVCIQRAIREHWRRQEAARARVWVLRYVVRLQLWWRGCLARKEIADRRARVAWITRKRLELEEVRILLEEESREEGAQSLLCYHEGWRTRGLAVSHPCSCKGEEAKDGVLEASWAWIYEDRESESRPQSASVTT